jgi:hypothetical protein
VRSSAEAGNLEALLDYWTERFDGGHPGDFDSCVGALTDKVDNPEALCAWLHHEATGSWPGQAPSEKNGKLFNDTSTTEIVDTRDELTKKVTEQIRGMEKSLLQSGTPVQPFRPKTQTWLSILESPEEKHLPGQHDQSEHGRRGAGTGDNAPRVPKTAYTINLPKNYGQEDPPPPGETHDQALARYQALGYIPPKEITNERDANGRPLFLHGHKELFQLFKKPDGTYAQSRIDLLHQPVVDQVMKGISNDNPKGIEGGIPKADGPQIVNVMGGGAAAGKSTVLKTLPGVPGRDQAIYQEADEYKAAIPEYRAMLLAGMSDVAAGDVHEESSDMGKMVRDRAMDEGYHLVSDALYNDTIEKNEAKVAAFRRDGAAEVHAHYVTTDLQDAAERLMSRQADTGRAVPYDLAMESHQKVAAMLPALAGKFTVEVFSAGDTSSKYSAEHRRRGPP